ncbi:MAG: Tol-Pal system beta propeller repeat protein TolB [Proteobacteria bacterium]|nr:MAG: Tol-Pal system beta propeller repeat protein TolB [Pseudomonadota bacterium]
MNRVRHLAVSLSTVLLAAFAQPVFAQLTIEITKGVEAGIPIAVVPFEWKGASPPPQQISDVIEADLVRSGRFDATSRDDFLEAPHDNTEISYKNWRLLKTEALVVGRMKVVAPGRYEVRFQLMDVYKERQLAGYQFVVDDSKLRKVAHQISDIIYEALIGKPGAFDTRIAYVTVQEQASSGNRYLLMIADSDGYGAREILSSTHPIMSPAWSPNGERLAYVSFEGGRSMVYVQEIFSGKRSRLADFEGLNSAPAWSPDGTRLALTLSRDGNPEIYVMQLSNGSLKRITNHGAIDTEPSWSPDGRSIVFTSDRAGRPQIYQAPAGGGEPSRLTFEGKYNARASFSPSGDRLVMVTNQGGGYQIGVFYLANRALQVLTDSNLDESPSFAPNGDMILYASQAGGRGVLAAVSSDGRVKQRLRFLDGAVREPAWSPSNQKL